jgi:hypothetical protein|tara:strand:- start:5821 stop:6276 length:456 start_codon:yes stop_codon:yes gene_type:complete
MKITKSHLRQIIKEELQTELFGFGKKKEEPKAAASSTAPDLTKILVNLSKMKGTDQFVAAYNENPGLFVSAVRLGVEGLPKDNRFRNPLMQKYKPYIDKLFKANPKGIEDRDNSRRFGQETEKFVFALQDYAKDEMDPDLEQLAKNLEKIR